jgi:hypothetical protein
MSNTQPQVAGAFWIDPVIAMLHNTGKDRWHPILFDAAPLPGGESSIVRHRSRMHHTDGFDTREAAEKNARDDLAQKIPGCRLALERVIEWDGEGVPALTEFSL